MESVSIASPWADSSVEQSSRRNIQKASLGFVTDLLQTKGKQKRRVVFTLARCVKERAQDGRTRD